MLKKHTFIGRSRKSMHIETVQDQFDDVKIIQRYYLYTHNPPEIINFKTEDGYCLSSRYVESAVNNPAKTSVQQNV